MFKNFFKTNWIHLIAIAIFIISTAIIYFPALQGKKLQQGDIVNWQGMAQESQAFHDKTGETTLWTNSMFGGMPTYYINFKKSKDPVDWLITFVKFGFIREVGNTLIALFGFYLLMLVLKVDPKISIIAALSFAFATNNLVLLEAGHYTKLGTLMTSPLVIAGVILTYRKNWIPGLLLFAFGLSMNLKAEHPQMTYYLGICLGLYVITKLVYSFKEKELPDFFKSSIILLFGAALALGSTAAKTLPILEYSKDTMRGAPILKNSKSNDSSSKVEGLAWDYAMSWSNGPEDLLQSFISHSVGGSSAEFISSKSKFAKELKRRNAPSRNFQAPLYWGSLPFTSGPIYFGAIVFFLMFISAFHIEGPLKYWIVSAVVLTMLLSMGKNMEWINKLFFNYFPMYNKFRTPNSILTVTTLLIPILAFLGLDRILSAKSFDKKTILYPALGMIIFTCLIALVGPGIFDMSAAGDLRLAQAGIDPNILVDDRAALLRSSGLKSCLFMAITLAILWAVYKNIFNKVTALGIIGILTMADLVSVNLKYVSHQDYKSERKYQAQFLPRPVDEKIMADADQHYRVLDNSINTFNSSRASYWHKTIGGYHAAKLQRYQDMIDYHISKGNAEVLNMLNTKYIITGQQGAEQSRLNTAALGNAWFVNSVKFVNNPDEEIEALNNFDPLGQAIIHKEFQSELKTQTFNKAGATIALKKYEPNKLTYQTNSSTDQLAVFSEVWYGPNKGWQAYIDGTPVNHMRANYILRALNVPSGSHEIVFEFKPQSYKSGTIISWVCSLLMFAGLGFYTFKKWKEE